MIDIGEHYDTFSEYRPQETLSLQVGVRKQPPKQGRLLLVEDEPLSQKYCQLLLLSAGFKLDIAANGQLALDYVTKRRYQGILMDVGLPDLSGIDITRIIRSTKNPNHRVPIIALTAHLDASKQDACVEAGMTAFLVKPVSAHTLCELLALSLKNARSSLRP